jgi:hypothetical protein
MKVIITLILTFSLFQISKKKCLAQSIELAGTYTTSDANFYKNAPGISSAYAYHFKKQFVFIEFKTSKKGNNSFSSFDYTVSEYYRIESAQGDFSTLSVNVGAAQKLVTSNCLEFSVGADVGLNYYKQDNEYISIGLDKKRNDILYFNSSNEIEKRKNKFGIGAFIDMELKGIIFDELSIFSRLNIYHSEYGDKHALRDDVPKTSKINNVSFRVGVKYRITFAKD